MISRHGKFLVRLLSFALIAFLAVSCNWFSDEDKASLNRKFNDTIPTGVDSSLFLYPRNFFLVTFEFEPLTHKLSKEAMNEFSTSVLVPGYSFIDSLRQSGVPIFGGVYAVKQGCAFMLQAETNESLHEMLKDCPLNPFSKISITPLVSLGQYLFEIKNRLKTADSLQEPASK